MTSAISRRDALAIVGGSVAMLGARGVKAAAPPVVKVGIIPLFAVAPHFAAEAHGDFAAEGIAVSTQTVQSSALGIPGLVSGSFDVVYASTVSVLTALERGIDLRIVAESTRVPATPPDGVALFRRKGDNIATGKDLEGKVTAINARFSMQWLAISRWIKASGGDLGKVTFREIPSPSMLDALKNGQVDAAYLLDPFKLFASEDPSVELFAWPSSSTLPGLSTSVWVVSGSLADEKPELVRSYLRGFMKGAQWVNENFGNQAYFELVASFTKMDPARLARLAAEPQIMEISVDSINKLGDVMREFGLVTTSVDVSSKVFK